MKKAMHKLLVSILISSCAAPLPLLAQQATAAPTRKAQHKKLDLKAPDITKLYGWQRLSANLAQTRSNIEEVEVRGARDLLPQTDTEMPQVWNGIAAPVWALLHPTGAWRILAPVSLNAPQSWSEPPDATSTYASLVAFQPRY